METAIRKPISIENIEKLAEDIRPLEAVFDQIEDHIVITDENANIIYANKAVQNETGYNIGEIFGRNPGDIWGSRMSKEFYEKMWYQVKIKKKPFSGEIQNQRKDGSMYWQELIILPILDENKNIKFFIGIEPNITSKKISQKVRKNFLSSLEKRMKDALESAREAQDWLLVKGKLNQKQKDKLEIIYEQHQNIEGLLNNFLSFVKNSA